MINSVLVFNVGHGDCSILKNDESSMLVDFGGSRAKTVRCLNDVINNLSGNFEKNLMITHLHRDHYNAIKFLANYVVFDNVYLPDYISGHGMYILAAALLLKNNYIISVVKSILKLPFGMYTNKMISPNGKIHFVVSGNIVKNSLDDFEILLPNPFQSNLPVKLKEKIYQNENISRFVENYRNAIVEINEKNSNTTYFYDLNESINSLITNESMYFDEDEIINIKKEFKHYHNSMSIVFQNYTEEENNNVLFCGDALSKDIKKVSFKFHHKYRVIKIPHHGTYRGHYYDNFPNSEYFIIFNDFQSRCSPITFHYDDRYGCLTKFICTNQNCDKIIKNMHCKSKSCKNAICGLNSNYIVI